MEVSEFVSILGFLEAKSVMKSILLCSFDLAYKALFTLAHQYVFTRVLLITQWQIFTFWQITIIQEYSVSDSLFL